MFSSLLTLVLPGHRDDAGGGEARRHRHSGEDGAAVRQATSSDSSCDNSSAFPRLVSAVSQELLTSGAVVLPGRSSHEPEPGHLTGRGLVDPKG